MDQDKMSNHYRGPSIDASYQFRFIWPRPSGFRGEDFRNRPTRNKNCLLWPWLLIDASYQVSVHLAKQFQRRRFRRNWQIRNKNCLWRPYLLTDRDEMSNLYRGPSIDASGQGSVHFAKQFQRRRFKCEKLTNGGRQTRWAKMKFTMKKCPQYN
jgi:hypothetical protein